MKLSEVLESTGDFWQPLEAEGFQVFVDVTHPDRWRYFHLSDFLVSSVVSGPSYILIPRKRWVICPFCSEENEYVSDDAVYFCVRCREDFVPEEGENND